MSERLPYRAFLEAKALTAPASGVVIDPQDLNPALRPVTRAVVPWLLKGGRRAAFLKFGLHKTATQIETLRLLAPHCTKPRLIILPLGVRREFFNDAARHFTGAHAVTLRFIRRTAEIDGTAAIYLTNYEAVREGNVDPALFEAVSLDEASILRSYGSKTYQEFTSAFAATRFALPATFLSLWPGSPREDVWTDIARMRTLNTEQAMKGREKHLCLARDSLVLTRQGYKPIQSVAVGDEVLTHRGRWRPVLVVANTGVQSVVTLRAQGVPALTLTPDHKLWTRLVRDTPWARNHSRLDAQLATPDWARADATVGSYVNLKLPEAQTPTVEDLTYWWTVGRWLADGHIGARGGAIISCGDHEQNELMARLGAFGGNPFMATGTCSQIRLRDIDYSLRKTLAVCGRGAAGKQLPPEAYTLPAAQARALLDGYLAGDGHYRADRNRWMASSVSRALLLGIAMLAQRVHGAIASVYAGRPGGQSIIQGRTVVTRQDWILSFDVPDAERRKGLPFIQEDGAWKRVRQAEAAGEVETWCLRVEEDESFTAEGCIVKNCPLQFDIVDRLIRRYSNPGDLVFDPFAGLGTVPLRAVKMGRRGLGSELNTGYFADAVTYLQAQDRKQATPSLFDFLAAEPAPIAAE